MKDIFRMLERWIISFFAVTVMIEYASGVEIMSPPVISKNIITETKPVGSTGRLNCTVANLGTNQVFWNRLPPPDSDNQQSELISMGRDIKHQNPVVAHGLRKYDVIVSKSSLNEELIYTLVIRSLVQDDDGTYECSIQVLGTPNDKWPHRNGILYVQRPPNILKALSTSTMTSSVGESVTLECHADGRPEPNITWSRNMGTLKDPRDDEMVLRVMNSSYTINNVTAADRGLYRCMANNNVKPPAVHEVTLLVKHKPVINAFRNHVGQAPDKNLKAEMACKVTGYPDPVVTWWRKEGKTWKPVRDSAFNRIDKLYGHGPNLDVIGSWSSLRIINVKMGDFGLYKCRGENIYGSTEEEIKFFLTTTCQGADCRLGFSVRGRSAGTTTVPLSFATLLLWTLVRRFIV